MVFGVISIVLLVAGLFTINDYSTIDLKVKKIYYNFNLLLPLGISVMIVLLYVILQLNKSKEKYFQGLRDMTRKFEGINEIIYEFDEDELIIDRKLKYEKINWKLFTNKIYHDNFIFLNYSYNMLDGISIDGRLFTESDFLAIKQMIDKKIQ